MCIRDRACISDTGCAGSRRVERSAHTWVSYGNSYRLYVSCGTLHTRTNTSWWQMKEGASIFFVFYAFALLATSTKRLLRSHKVSLPASFIHEQDYFLVPLSTATCSTYEYIRRVRTRFLPTRPRSLVAWLRGFFTLSDIGCKNGSSWVAV